MAHGMLIQSSKDGFDTPDVDHIIMMYYLAWAYDRGLKFTTIMTYISGIRTWFRLRGKPDPCTIRDGTEAVHPQFFQAVRGLKRIHKGKPADRFPVTAWIMEQLLRACRSGLVLTRHQAANVEACAMLMWFGLLRVGEATSTDTGRAPERVALRGDIQFHPSEADCKYITFQVKSSKTDQFRDGFNLTIYRSGVPGFCPVESILGLFKRYPQPPHSPLFDFHKSEPREHKRYASRATFVQLLKVCFQATGVDDRGVKSHSFRQGGASAAAMSNPPQVVRMLGRWTSDCWMRYISMPLTHLQVISNGMASVPRVKGNQTDYIMYQ